ncbi:hypothetical protein SAMN04488065_1766 [Haloplanus vescus]|uniref:Uncharacterized protein n=1 Tax=Haloplanus vescus TaxID=555874 RepID=A0A1H3YAZ2_9EURY|nr:hypothetical protein [Haloplanus vescus]SEA08720.1 hypothetical protein SAMN04488065_1766 [Haloplanus vescus]
MDADAFLTRDTALILLLLVVGIGGSGLARGLLAERGYGALGSAIFVVGYGTMVILLWYGWIRPLDITGPSGR